MIMRRPMGQFEVLQRTSDGFFDGNALLLQWNKVPGNPRRKISEFLESPKTQEFIKTLQDDIYQCRKNDNVDLQVVKEIKGRTGKGGKTPNRVYMHPFLFIKFAMWINPKFELQVIKFVYDELIKNRHLAGDNYNVLTSAIATLPDSDYRQIATAIQWIVFNRTGKNLRQEATQEQLREISDIEQKVAFSINMGMVKNNMELIELLRKMWYKKYRKF